MNIPKTLDEARTMVAALAASNESLTANLVTLEAAGIVKSNFEEQISALTVELNEAKSSLATSTSEFNSSMEVSVNEKTALTARVSELEAISKTVSAQARELLASQGGKPLNIDGNDSIAASAKREELLTASMTEKDPVKFYEIYKQLKTTK